MFHEQRKFSLLLMNYLIDCCLQGDLNRHVKTVHTVGKKPRKRRSQPQESSELVVKKIVNGRDEHKIIDVVVS